MIDCRFVLLGLFAFCAAATASSADEPKPSDAKQPPVKELILPGESFLIEDRPAFIFWPPEEKRSTPQPWIFYAPTLPAYPDTHEKWMHEQFLEAGVAVAGIDVGEAYGSPKAIPYFDALYDELTQKRNFAKQPCLLGRSRGGLWVTSWAIEHPERVAGIAGIYPVFDLTTYPGLKRAAPAYDMSESELRLRLRQVNPISRVEELAKAKIPVCLIHGEVDKVVPIEENSEELQRRYQKALEEDDNAAETSSSLVQLIRIPDQGHNYWEGFFRCEELIEFAIDRAKGR